uniref:Uncharacterized protein n=1 Tax=Cacopsylla melanoneura TaxID=428564 RepID=A0A8D8W2B6_9HEMI
MTMIQQERHSTRDYPETLCILLQRLCEGWVNGMRSLCWKLTGRNCGGAEDDEEDIWNEKIMLEADEEETVVEKTKENHDEELKRLEICNEKIMLEADEEESVVDETKENDEEEFAKDGDVQ